MQSPPDQHLQLNKRGRSITVAARTVAGHFPNRLRTSPGGPFEVAQGRLGPPLHELAYPDCFGVDEFADSYFAKLAAVA